MDTHKSPSPSLKTLLKVMAAVTKPRLPKGSGLIAYALACTIAGLALTLAVVPPARAERIKDWRRLPACAAIR